MKKNLLALIVVFSFILKAQQPIPPIMLETFEYPAGQLTDRGGGANVSGGNWVDTSGGGNYILVEQGSLSYNDVFINGGKKIKITASTASSEDVWRNFRTVDHGTVYVSFLMKLIDTTLLAPQTATSSEYFIGVLSSTQTTAYGSRIYARKGNGKSFQLGIRATTNSGSTTPISWVNQDLNLEDAHLILFSYTFVDPNVTSSGSGNDTVKFWIDPIYPDPDHYPDPSWIPPNAISVATGGYEQPNISRIFIRQGSASGISTPSAYITNILVDTLLGNIYARNNDEEPLFKFNLNNLVYQNPSGPAMVGTGANAYLNYIWRDNFTTGKASFSQLPIASDTSKLTFKLNSADLILFKDLVVGPMTGDERVYGIDSGYIAYNQVPKIYFDQIVWHQASIYQINYTQISGIASIDTLRSDSAWLSGIGRQNKSITFEATSNNLVVQGTEGFYSAEINAYPTSERIRVSRLNQTDSTDFSSNTQLNSKTLPVNALFTPSPIYFATPNANNLTWGNRLFVAYDFGDFSEDEELFETILSDSSNLFIYPLEVLFGGTHTAYRSRVKIDISNMLNMFNDTLQDVVVYEYGMLDSLPKIIPMHRLQYINPSTILIDSIVQKGVNIFTFVKRRRSGGMFIKSDEKNIPTDFTLMQNYPNPFNPTTNILFGLPERSNVKIEIFNLLGQKVSTLVDENLPAGTHTKILNLNNSVSGIYFYKIDATSLDNSNKRFTKIKKMTLIK